MFQQFNFVTPQREAFLCSLGKFPNFTPVATAQSNALEKLFQLGVPRLIFHTKTLLTEVLVGSSNVIPEPACTCVQPETGAQANKNQIPEVYSHNWVQLP